MTENKSSAVKNKKALSECDIDRIIFKSLIGVGITANLKGFLYLSSAIKAVYYHPDAANNMVDGLYHAIAAEHSTASGSVEHAIRTALMRVHRPHNLAYYRENFGEDSGITAKKFIIAMANGIRKYEKSEIRCLPL